jgi:transposase
VIVLTDAERVELEGWARRRSSAAGLALRSRIVLAAADGESNSDLDARMGISRSTVKRWRNRVVEQRCDGLLDEPRPGRPRVVRDAQIEALITATLETTPPDATHWSTRSMAAHLGLSQFGSRGCGGRLDWRRSAPPRIRHAPSRAWSAQRTGPLPPRASPPPNGSCYTARRSSGGGKYPTSPRRLTCQHQQHHSFTHSGSISFV